MSFILHILLKSIAVFVVAKTLPGIYIRNFSTAILVAAIYGFINFLFGWILTFLAFPFVFITFGLFIFVIDAFLLWVTDKMLDDFEIQGFGTTLLAAFLISITSGILNFIFM